MHFLPHQPPEELRAAMGDWAVTLVPKGGIRLTEGTHFHLDEGLDFVYLSLYRVAANRRQVDVVRKREGAARIETGDCVVSWPPIDDNRAEMSVRYHILEEETAIEATFEVLMQRDYNHYELFVSSYFTPYHTPRFAVSDNRVDPEGPVRWYETDWYSAHNFEAWPRDPSARETFEDGRWTTSPAQNWVMGPDYALPLMTQRHRHAGAIIQNGTTRGLYRPVRVQRVSQLAVLSPLRPRCECRGSAEVDRSDGDRRQRRLWTRSTG